MTDSESQTFDHTGIRVMRADNGDLMFCDPGATTGVRDYLRISCEAVKLSSPSGKAALWDSLMKYVEGHERVRSVEPITFSYQPQK